MNELPYCWENIFHELVSETDPIKFGEKVREVEEALWTRTHQLSSESEHVANQRIASEDASETILKPKIERILPNLA